ncbi:MAG TPA: ABC transporter permease subunit [Solirubrobacterales bacterium]|jgi:ABC-2 type transport system permease protein
MTALLGAKLSERRRAVIAWGLPLGLWSAFIVAIYPSIESALTKAVRGYPASLKEAFGVGELTSVEQYLHAEMLSLIVPLVVGYLAIRSVAIGLSGAAESGRLDVLLSAPVSRRDVVVADCVATAIELALVLALSWLFAVGASAIFGSGLDPGSALAGFASVWPLALLAGAIAVVITGWSLHTPVVTGAAGGLLIAMYALDLVGRLDPNLDGLRYASVFRYYGNAIESGIDPWSFFGVVGAAVLLTAVGTVLFERRDLVA